MELRKQKEKEFHNKLRSKLLEGNNRYFSSNKKFYSITRKSVKFVEDWLLKNYKDKRVLDYCCGNGQFSILLAEKGIKAVGIDISDISIKNAKSLARKKGVADKTLFFVRDAEKTGFPDNYFDAVVCSGVLHHLDIEKAFSEIKRILKPEGKAICIEPLAYNPVFQLYRKITPHLRTEWEKEHILSAKEIKLAKKYFKKVETNFFHLTTLFCVPFRKFLFFNYILKFFEGIDSILLKVPIIKWLAWQIIFILSSPKK